MSGTKTFTMVGASLLIALGGFTGCVAGPDFGRISPGMSAEEVVKQLGRPYSRERVGNVEIIKYETEASYWDGRAGHAYSTVRLVDDKVVDYGRAGELVVTNTTGWAH